MFDKVEFLTRVNNIRRKNRKALSNYYLPPVELAVVADEQDSELLFNDNAVVLSRNDNGVSRVYFYLVDDSKKEDLKELVDMLKIKKPFVVEYIVKGKILESTRKVFVDCGFKHYTVMNQWVTNCFTNIIDSSQLCKNFLDDGEYIDCAKDGDCYQIQKILLNTFDPLISHLPTDKHLRELINSGLVYCLYKNDVVVAIECYETVGNQVMYGYQAAVVDEFRNTGIGMVLHYYSINCLCRDKKYNCWVEDGNKSAERMHKHVGLSKNGLKTYVFVKE
ncbi:MAG: hypothetical protein KBS60_02915 [Phascolarctobacterium sp.]|nr:hypothetical protein [Candidatus Phascolarctobacterium caballi]